MVGTPYLCWLGFRALRDALDKNVAVGTIGASEKPLRACVVCRDALLTNLLNPKVIFLFIASMPGFVAPERPMVQRGLAFASGLVFIAFAVLMVVEFILVPA